MASHPSPVLTEFLADGTTPGAATLKSFFQAEHQKAWDSAQRQHGIMVQNVLKHLECVKNLAYSLCDDITKLETSGKSPQISLFARSALAAGLVRIPNSGVRLAYLEKLRVDYDKLVGRISDSMDTMNELSTIATLAHEAALALARGKFTPSKLEMSGFLKDVGLHWEVLLAKYERQTLEEMSKGALESTAENKATDLETWERLRKEARERSPLELAESLEVTYSIWEKILEGANKTSPLGKKMSLVLKFGGGASFVLMLGAGIWDAAISADPLLDGARNIINTTLSHVISTTLEEALTPVVTALLARITSQAVAEGCAMAIGFVSGFVIGVAVGAVVDWIFDLFTPHPFADILKTAPFTPITAELKTSLTSELSTSLSDH